MEQQTSSLQPNDTNYLGWKKKTTLFLSSQSLSIFGSTLVQYAIIWYLTLTTQSGVVLTIATIVGFLPQLVISPFAGVWADRYHRKLLIIAADVLTAASTLALAVFFLVGYRELWLIFVVSGIRSLGAGIQSPAVNALLPQIVPPERLMKVNSINGFLNPMLMIASPVLSGAMLSYARLEDIFFVDVFTAFLAVLLLVFLQVPAHQGASAPRETGYLDEIKAGWVYIRGNRVVRAVFTFYAFISFLVVPVAFLTPLLVARSFGEEVWRLTANEVTFFVGSILGGIFLTVWGGFSNRFRNIGLSCIIWAFLFVGLGLSKTFTLYLVFMFLSGIPLPFLHASTNTLLQEMTRPDMHGRVFSVLMLITNTIMPVGMLIFGPLADVVTIELLLVVSGVFFVLPGWWMVRKEKPPAAEVSGLPEEFELQPGD